MRKHFEYVVFTEFGSKATCRIHAHIFIFAKDNTAGLERMKFFRDEYNARYHTTSENGVCWRHIGDGMVAAYASKYSSKALNMQRIMSSQFKEYTFISHNMMRTLIYTTTKCK